MKKHSKLTGATPRKRTLSQIIDDAPSSTGAVENLALGVASLAGAVAILGLFFGGYVVLAMLHAIAGGGV